jgi:uncharacterized protein HemX
MWASVYLVSATIGCAGGSVTKREAGAGIGALAGRPGVGAIVGGLLGLGAGALVGDQIQGQDNRQTEQQRQIDANQAELERQRRELERQRKQGEY